MRAGAVVDAILGFDVAQYVAAARRDGRHKLDPVLRGEMATLYEDLRDVRARIDVPAEVRPQLRLAELLLESEWKLAGDEEPGGTRGRRYQAYANNRLLSHVLGTRRHSSDAAIERRSRWALHTLVDSWLRFERSATEWSRDMLPTDAELAERVDRLTHMHAATAPHSPVPRIAPEPPSRWPDYLGDGQGNVLEYLINLPQTTQHDENAFLRVIHLTETATWGMIARVVAAGEWLKKDHWDNAAHCLDRAAALAQVQLDAMLVLRRTMSVERFMGFRADTGSASAVQMLSGQLLQIHLLGIHPHKIEALSRVYENAFLLLHLNPEFEPLRTALRRVPTDHDTAAKVLTAAETLDDTLFRWRRVHLGMAHRHLPKESGSGGTAGAPYLQSFYDDRLFNDGILAPQPQLPTRPPLPNSVYARPIFSPLN
jgi:tryptophan 2,3-dioxygenase